jgi:hypothetical protein
MLARSRNAGVRRFLRVTRHTIKGNRNAVENDSVSGGLTSERVRPHLGKSHRSKLGLSRQPIAPPMPKRVMLSNPRVVWLVPAPGLSNADQVKHHK